MPAYVAAVSSSSSHSFSKTTAFEIKLLTGLGVEGDAHCGVTVKHRSHAARDPKRPNLRQVHLLHAELFDDLSSRGFTVLPGQLGENITTSGIDLLGSPAGTRLHIGASAIVELTGLRNPCAQIDRFKAGLMSAVLGRTPEGKLILKAGVMSIVIAGGIVQPGDAIHIELPARPHRTLERV